MVSQQLEYFPIRPERAMWWPLGCYLWRCLNHCHLSSDDLISALALKLNSLSDIGSESMKLYVYLINGALQVSYFHQRVALCSISDELGYRVGTITLSLDADDETDIFSYSERDSDSDD